MEISRTRTAWAISAIAMSFVVMSSGGFGQDLLWTAQLGTISLAGEIGCQSDHDGNIYVACAAPYSPVLTKYDKNGNMVWQYKGTGGGINHSRLAISSDGSIFLVSNDSDNVLTSRFDSSGNLIWMKTYDYAGYDDLAVAAQTDSLGNVFVAGEGYTYGGYQLDSFVLKYDKNGKLLWSRVRAAPQSDITSAIAVDDQNNLIVIGSVANPITPHKLVLIKYDPKGNVLWEQEYSPEPDCLSAGYCLAIDHKGGVVVGGTYRKPDLIGSTDYGHLLISKYDLATGNLEWVNTSLATPDGVDLCVSVKFDPTGTIHASVFSGLRPYETPSWVTIMRLDELGNVLNQVAQSDCERPTIAAENDGSTCVAVQSRRYPSDLITFRVSPIGNIVWSKAFRVGETYSQTPVSTITDPSGNCYAICGSYDSNNFSDKRVALLEYSNREATGSLLGSLVANDLADTTGFEAVIELREPGNLLPFAKYPVVLGSSGTFAIDEVIPGTYDASVKPSHWLRQTLPNIDVGPSGANVAFSLRNGDATRDNFADLKDISRIFLDWETTEPMSDLNSDGVVDLPDLSIAFLNFGQKGDQ